MPEQTPSPVETSRVEVFIDGERLSVDAGITLAAALINDGRLGWRYSPTGGLRGPLCGMGTCFECRVAVEGEGLRRACRVRCREGLRASTDSPSPRNSGKARDA